VKSISEVKKVKNQINHQLLAIPGVTALAIGPKIIGGTTLPELAIRVYVEKKRKQTEVPAHQLIPKEVDGVSIDVVERPNGGEIQGSQVPDHEKKKYDRLEGGAPIGGIGDIGTLTAIVYDNLTGESRALVSRHVIEIGRASCRERV